MGFLDKKERIIDLVLTDKGRQMLSKGLLDFKYYAFSDDGIDYKFIADKGLSGSLDEEVYKTITFEADQYTNERKQPVNNKLNSILFTVPNSQKVLPRLKTSKDENTTFNITREYYSIDLQEVLEKGVSGEYISVIGRFSEETFDNSREQQFVIDQISSRQKRNNTSQEFKAGAIYDRDHILINSEEALNVVAGTVEQLAVLRDGNRVEDVISDNFSKKVEVVTGMESEDVVCKLADGIVKDGFLIEVFESGSQGYTRVDSETVINAAIGVELSEGYDKFLNLKEIGEDPKKKKINTSYMKTLKRFSKKSKRQ